MYVKVQDKAVWTGFVWFRVGTVVSAVMDPGSLQCGTCLDQLRRC